MATRPTGPLPSFVRQKRKGHFHVVRFAYNDRTTHYEIYLDNKPYMAARFGGMSRRMARAFCKLLNGEARWPA